VQIDWDAIGAAMKLKKGAIMKRWSRLKKSMQDGQKPGGSVYQFLWLCVKHSKRDKVSAFTLVTSDPIPSWSQR
jgi:hypothetical protein